MAFATFMATMPWFAREAATALNATISFAITQPNAALEQAGTQRSKNPACSAPGLSWALGRNAAAIATLVARKPGGQQTYTFHASGPMGLPH